MGKFSEMDILIQESYGFKTGYDIGYKAGFNEAKEASEEMVKEILADKDFHGIHIRLEK